MSNILIVLSALPETMDVPSVWKATQCTVSSWSDQVCKGLGEEISHSLSNLSSDPVATSFEVGSKFAQRTQLL